MDCDEAEDRLMRTDVDANGPCGYVVDEEQKWVILRAMFIGMRDIIYAESAATLEQDRASQCVIGIPLRIGLRAPQRVPNFAHCSR